jgi:hypothetical protein
MNGPGESGVVRPAFCGVRKRIFWPRRLEGECRKGYPLEFRREVLDLVAAGRPVVEVISAQSVYTWWRQDQIERVAGDGEVL